MAIPVLTKETLLQTNGQKFSHERKYYLIATDLVKIYWEFAFTNQESISDLNGHRLETIFSGTRLAPTSFLIYTALNLVSTKPL